MAGLPPPRPPTSAAPGIDQIGRGVFARQIIRTRRPKPDLAASRRNECHDCREPSLRAVRSASGGVPLPLIPVQAPRPTNCTRRDFFPASGCAPPHPARVCCGLPRDIFPAVCAPPISVSIRLGTSSGLGLRADPAARPRNTPPRLAFQDIDAPPQPVTASMRRMQAASSLSHDFEQAISPSRSTCVPPLSSTE